MKRNRILVHFQKLDWTLITILILLTTIGLLVIYSCSLAKNDFSNFKKQLVFFVFGFFLMFFLSFLDWRILKNDSFLILIFYGTCLILLIGLFLFAPEIRGTKSWYKIGYLSINPIEFTKIILLILLAKYFSTRHTEIHQIKHIFLSGLYVLIPMILIFLYPDLGSVLILFFLWFGILIISGIKFRHFLILFLIFLIIFIFSWSVLLKEYQKQRILSFVQPQLADPLTVGWNQRQAKIAIGSGGIFGYGFGKGSQTQLGFLPEPQTDFTFAVIAEEFGLLGVTILFLLFFLLLWRIIKIGILANNNFARFFSLGFAISLLIQIFINIGMNLGILPIIGIPLVLISYGGSNLITTFIGFGILQSIRSC